MDFAYRIKTNLQRKRGRKKASYFLNLSFAPDKAFRFLLIKLNLLERQHNNIPRSESGVQVCSYAGNVLLSRVKPPVRSFPVMIYRYISCYRHRFCVSRLIPVMFTGVCMTHRITCLIPTCKNKCGRNNTKTTFWEIFFIGYHFITARKVSSAISRSRSRSSLNVWRECNRIYRYIITETTEGLTRESRTLPLCLDLDLDL